MKLQDQVCSLEQAKQLKELGVYGESLITVADRSGGVFMSSLDIDDEYSPCYCAFTVAELGEMLPPDYQWSWPLMTRNVWYCAYCDAGEEGAVARYAQAGYSEAQARAAMLIYLLASGKVTAEDVNARLAK